MKDLYFGIFSLWIFSGPCRQTWEPSSSVLTSGSRRSTYGWQVGGTCPARILSCPLLKGEIRFQFPPNVKDGYDTCRFFLTEFTLCINIGLENSKSGIIYFLQNPSISQQSLNNRNEFKFNLKSFYYIEYLIYMGVSRI